MLNYYMPDTTNVSWACKTDVNSFYIELARRTDWAVRSEYGGRKGEGRENVFVYGLCRRSELAPGLEIRCFSTTRKV